MTRLHRATLAVTALAAVAAATACSSPSSTPATTVAPSSSAPSHTTTTQTSAPTTTQTSAPTTSATNPTSPATEQSTTHASSSGTSACAESQLRASVSSENVPDFHVLRVTLANTSATACTLTGFPGAAIVDASGAQIQQAKRVVGGPVAGTVEQEATLTVSPGGSVFAYLEGQSTKKPGAAQAGCDAPDYPKILITPPDTRTAVPFTAGWPPCYTFDIHPVREQ